MSSDADTMYDAEMAVLADLAERFPEVDAERDALERKASYKHGKRLLRMGEGRAAREPLETAIAGGTRDARLLALLAVAYAPRGHARLLRLLERAQERFAR